MYKRKAYKGVIEDTQEEFICDTRSDVASLPTDPPHGSVAFVIEDSSTWMITSSGLWEEIEVGGGGGGVTPSFSIGTVTTGEPGTDADATITGTDEAPVLNLTIPRGSTGDPGEVPAASIASGYSNTKTYDVGEYVWQSGNLYRCKTAIDTAEEWTAAHWEAAKVGDDVADLKEALDDKYDRYKVESIEGLSLDMFSICPSQYTIVQYDNKDAIQHSSLSGSGLTWIWSKFKNNIKDIKFKIHYRAFSATPDVRIIFAASQNGAIAFSLNATSGNIYYITANNATQIPGQYRNENCRSIAEDDTLHLIKDQTKIAIYLVDNNSEIPIFADEWIDILAEYSDSGITAENIGFGLATNNAARNEPLIFDFSYIKESGDHFIKYDEADGRLTALENGMAPPNAIDLFLFMGQSNMAGRGTGSQAPTVTAGAGYEFRAVTDPTKLYPIEEPFGVNENNTGAIDDKLGGTNAKSGDMIPAFINAYFAHTHYPIVGVSASEGGTRISYWQPGTDRYTDALSRWNAAITYLNANNYNIRHKYVIWCQGESDGDVGTTKNSYKSALESLADTWLENGAEAFFVVKIGNYNGDSPTIHYNDIMTAQNEVCQSKKNVIMISTDFAGMKARDLMKDDYHYKQIAYNEVGDYAGINTAIFVNSGKEPTMYDTQNNNLYYTHKN